MLDVAAGLKDPKSIDIEAVIPHRYPLLLIDRIVAIEPYKHIQAYKLLSNNEPQFVGHFPHLKVFPGVYMAEAVAQAGCVLGMYSLSEGVLAEKDFFLTFIHGAKYRRTVVPGDKLDINVEVSRIRRMMWRFSGTLEVDGVVVAEVDLSCIAQSRQGS